ncbi:spore protease YyaC [Paenibacillus sp. LjRoot56]|uniref:spore protease YyaC n=1 Tax=Paenibacillus sp. LjRoot56 TaxID=3342333 RepID=UPI003ECDDC5F
MIHFACIGTDRSTGDSLGPLVGTRLQALGYPVTGTLDEPLHAMNMEKRLAEIPEGVYIVAVDAALGQVSSVGTIKHMKGPIKPGAGVNKDLKPVGDYHYMGIVNVGGFMEYFVLQNTRLSLVMKMADEIVGMIQQKFGNKLLEVAATKEGVTDNERDGDHCIPRKRAKRSATKNK